MRFDRPAPRARAPLLMLLIAATALAGCAGNAGDGDGLSADFEIEGWDVTVTSLGGHTATRHVTSEPSRTDTDGDGLNDYVEQLEKLDPRSEDTDADGLLDGHTLTLRASDTRARAWREAGIVILEESSSRVTFAGERGVKGEPLHGDPRDQDTDGDGLIDGDEVRGYLVSVIGVVRHVQTALHLEDTDGDAIFDGEERRLGLDGAAADSDGDGAQDLFDVNPWLDVALRFRVASLELTADPEGRSERSVHLTIQAGGVERETPEVVVAASDPAGAAALTGPFSDVPDTGGHLEFGEHQVGFTVTALSRDRSGRDIVLDLFTKTTGAQSLFGSLDALRNVTTAGSGGADIAGAWPVGARFEGAHGAIVLRVDVRDWAPVAT